VPCPIKVEEVCIEYIDKYNSLVDAAIEYVKSHSIDSCLWNDRIVIPDNLKKYASTHGYSEDKVTL
jgi:hypothetical protein